MNIPDRFSVKKSLVTLAGVCGFGIVLSTAAGYLQTSGAMAAASKIYTERTEPSVDLLKAVNNLHRARQLILTATSEEREDAALKHLQQIQQTETEMDAAFNRFASVNAQHADDLKKVRALIAEYNQAKNQSVKMIEVGDLPSALENIKSNAGPKFALVLSELERLINEQSNGAARDYKETKDAIESSNLYSLLMLTLLFVISSVMFFVIGKMILRQLGGEPGLAAETVRQVASGNLNAGANTRATTGLLADIGQMSISLASIVREIRAISDGITERSTSSFGHMQNVAARSAEQSTAATSVAAAVEELAVSIDSVACNAHETELSASASLETAKEGFGAVRELVSSMEQLSKSSDRSAATVEDLVLSSRNIMGIVVRISDIADQTNLLALNAAIEAARAGEQGRGFAVVADEVRKLAEKTTAETREIQSVLTVVDKNTTDASMQMGDSHRQIKESSERAHEVVSMIEAIETQLVAIAVAAKDTSTSLKEQTTASQMIASQVERIAEGATNNAQAAMSVVGEASFVSQSAEVLSQHMSRFSV